SGECAPPAHMTTAGNVVANNSTVATTAGVTVSSNGGVICSARTPRDERHVKHEPHHQPCHHHHT
ncbi:jg941, partial [Pararge aegeria aegeria]